MDLSIKSSLLKINFRVYNDFKILLKTLKFEEIIIYKSSLLKSRFLTIFQKSGTHFKLWIYKLCIKLSDFKLFKNVQFLIKINNLL
jgi:hypothetical protein